MTQEAPEEADGAEPGPASGNNFPRLTTGTGPAARLLAEGLYYTNEELVTALRSRLAELTNRAVELEGQVVAAQARLGALVRTARARSLEAESARTASVVPEARQEAIAIVQDARRRAAELGQDADASVAVDDLGNMLVAHFQLQEELVPLVTEISKKPLDRRVRRRPHA